MKRIRRHQAFLQNVLKQANRNKRNALLQQAKADEINALSELSLNLLRRHIPVTMGTVQRMRSHNALRAIASRRDSVKKCRKALLKQKGGSFWQGMNDCLQACHHRKRPKRHVK